MEYKDYILFIEKILSIIKQFIDNSKWLYVLGV